MHRRALLLVGFASGGIIALGISLMQPKIHQCEAVISLAFDQGHPEQKQSMDSAFMSWLREQILTLSTPSSSELEPLHIHQKPSVTSQRDFQKIATNLALGASAGITLALLISYLTPKPSLTSNT